MRMCIGTSTRLARVVYDVREVFTEPVGVAGKETFERIEMWNLATDPPLGLCADEQVGEFSVGPLSHFLQRLIVSLVNGLQELLIVREIIEICREIIPSH